MIATTSSDLRENMKEYFDRVTDGFETMIVTRRNDANVVVISQADALVHPHHRPVHHPMKRHNPARAAI